MRPEQHFDRVKAATDQMALDLAARAEVVQGPWVRPCGDLGPYAVRRPTPKHPNRLVVLACNRPDGHAGAFHTHTNHDAVPVASWGRDGRPNFPPIIERGRVNASDIPV